MYYQCYQFLWTCVESIALLTTGLLKIREDFDEMENKVAL